MLPEIFPTQTTDNTACALATRSEGCGVEGGKLDTITDNLRVPSVTGRRSRHSRFEIAPISLLDLGSSDPSKVRSDKHLLFRWMQKNQAALKTPKRTTYCLARAISSDDPPEVVLKGFMDAGGVERTQAGYTKLQRCNLHKFCPVCARVEGIKRAGEIAQQAQAHVSNGGSLAFLTLTIPHEQGDSEKKQLDLLQDAWTTMMKRKEGLRLFGPDSNAATWMRTVEVTFASSWSHNHIHVLLFLKRPFEGSPNDGKEHRVMQKMEEEGLVDTPEIHTEVEQYATRVFNLWESVIKARSCKYLGRVAAPKWGAQDLTIPRADSSNHLAGYLAKTALGLGFEITGYGKTGSIGSRTAMQLLIDIATARCEIDQRKDLKFWHEHVEAVAGRQLITSASGDRHPSKVCVGWETEDVFDFNAKSQWIEIWEQLMGVIVPPLIPALIDLEADYRILRLAEDMGADASYEFARICDKHNNEYCSAASHLDGQALTNETYAIADSLLSALEALAMSMRSFEERELVRAEKNAALEFAAVLKAKALGLRSKASGLGAKIVACGENVRSSSPPTERDEQDENAQQTVLLWGDIPY